MRIPTEHAIYITMSPVSGDTRRTIWISSSDFIERKTKKSKKGSHFI